MPHSCHVKKCNIISLSQLQQKKSKESYESPLSASHEKVSVGENDDESDDGDFKCTKKLYSKNSKVPQCAKVNVPLYFCKKECKIISSLSQLQQKKT